MDKYYATLIVHRNMFNRFPAAPLITSAKCFSFLVACGIEKNTLRRCDKPSFNDPPAASQDKIPSAPGNCSSQKTRYFPVAICKTVRNGNRIANNKGWIIILKILFFEKLFNFPGRDAVVRSLKAHLQ